MSFPNVELAVSVLKNYRNKDELNVAMAIEYTCKFMEEKLQAESGDLTYEEDEPLKNALREC